MLNTEWQLSGNMAQRYEEYLVPVIFEPWARDLLSRGGLTAGQTLLDLACGTGVVARLAAQDGILATGGDINDGMLAVARQTARDLSATFAVVDAQNIPFEDQSFDAVICQQGLQFFPDKAAAIRECFRVLKPGGLAIFCTARSLDENPLMLSQVMAFGRFLGDAGADAIRAVCSFGGSEASRSLFAAGGFDPVSVEKVALNLVAEDGHAFVDGLMKATPAAQSIASMEPAERQALHSALLEGFGEYYDGKALRFPHSSNVVVAKRPV